MNRHPNVHRGKHATHRGRARGFAAASARAVTLMSHRAGAPAADGPFDIDRTVPDSNTSELPDPFGSAKELGPLNSSTTLRSSPSIARPAGTSTDGGHAVGGRR